MFNKTYDLYLIIIRTKLMEKCLLKYIVEVKLPMGPPARSAGMDRDGARAEWMGQLRIVSNAYEVCLKQIKKT